MDRHNLLNLLSNTLEDLNFNVLDLNKPEDLNKVKEYLNELNNDNSLFGQFFKPFIGEDLETLINYLEEKTSAVVDKEEDNKREEVKPDIVITPEQKDVNSRPSVDTPENTKQQIAKLVEEYMNTKISPSGQFTSEQLNSVCDGLFEFACWIYNK